MNKPADRPPVLRFLLIFAMLLAVALGLAMLAPSSGDAPDAATVPAGGSAAPGS